MSGCPSTPRPMKDRTMHVPAGTCAFCSAPRPCPEHGNAPEPTPEMLDAAARVWEQAGPSWLDQTRGHFRAALSAALAVMPTDDGCERCPDCKD